MFQFKQFTIQQDKTAMKVGTDGVLLGAWSPISHHPEAILDIGTGTGVIALMLAQRTNALQIDAFDIDENAFEQAADNFENSPWYDRLFCFHAGLDEFIEEPEDAYDLIVCNPPFYSENYRSGDDARNTARFSDAMPFSDLIEAADLLLSDHGVFSVIIPYKEEADFILLANDFELYPFKITRVKGTPESDLKRSLIAFGRANLAPEMNEIVIEIARHDYTIDYRNLTKDFYLKM